MNGLAPWRGTALSLLLMLLAACAGGQAMRAPAPPQATAAPAAVQQPAPADGVDAASAEAGRAPGVGQAPSTDAPPAAPGAAPAQAAPATAAAQPAPTQAEQDYAAIYGDQGQPAQDQAYDPLADPTLPPPAELPSSYDPWEPFNRRVHAFNNAVDRTIAKPLARAYIKVVPRPVRLGVSNFFNNLGQPVSMVNALLQGRPGDAGQSLMRFAVNSTIGLVGIFDPATRLNIPTHSEDFGQTLGVWGWRRSRYLELPLFGPRTVRDVFGLAGDAPLAPLQQIEEDRTRVFLQGLQLVDVRTHLMAVDRMREGAADEYALTRDAWLQRRNYQIQSDRREADDDLPEYLREEADPYVPVDVMPVPGGSGG